jgi:N-acetylmuramoyl-L-alanine amidase
VRLLCLAVIAVVGIALLALGTSAEARTGQPARVQISVDESGPSTRVVLTVSRPVAFAVTRSGKRVEVVYSEPVVLDPPSGKVDDPILNAWSQEGERAVSLRIGRRFERFETFELRNPSRLIIDLLGTKPKQPEVPISGGQTDTARTIIVIDPGHGGVENGAVGPTGLKEKDVALDLGLRLKRNLERSAVSVVLTRDDDRLLSLDERTATANHNRATLFISIHLNSARRSNARGAETYFLSTEASDDEARTLAALENKAYDAAGAVATESAGGDEALELILWDLAQNQYLAESSRLAESVQRELNFLVGTRDRGVRQAPFRVLTGATMPAILVEAGFLSNPEEEQLLASSAYRDRIVEAIGRAVRQFLSGRAQVAPPASSVGGAGASQQ